jgi:hypothetical protein
MNLLLKWTDNTLSASQGFIGNQPSPSMRGWVCSAALALKKFQMTAYSVLNVVLVKNLVEQAQFPVLAM